MNDHLSPAARRYYALKRAEHIRLCAFTFILTFAIAYAVRRHSYNLDWPSITFIASVSTIICYFVLRPLSPSAIMLAVIQAIRTTYDAIMFGFYYLKCALCAAIITIVLAFMVLFPVYCFIPKPIGPFWTSDLAQQILITILVPIWILLTGAKLSEYEGPFAKALSIQTSN